MCSFDSACTVYPKKYAHGFCFAVLCCGYTLTDFPISIRLTSLALWLSKDCPSASKATLMNMDKYFMWIHYELLHNHNKAKHNKTVCIFLGINCSAGCPYKSVDNFNPEENAYVTVLVWISLTMPCVMLTMDPLHNNFKHTHTQHTHGCTNSCVRKRRGVNWMRRKISPARQRQRSITNYRSNRDVEFHVSPNIEYRHHIRSWVCSPLPQFR